MAKKRKLEAWNSKVLTSILDLSPQCLATLEAWLEETGGLPVTTAGALHRGLIVQVMFLQDALLPLKFSACHFVGLFFRPSEFFAFYVDSLEFGMTLFAL